jgi:Pentapeptide repeats (8 copies)
VSISRAELRADCSRCAGLCCVVPAFAQSSDFAIDKPSGVACPNLAAPDAGDFRCSIHADLRERGFRGCTVYDCFGAGQRVVQEHFSGRDWVGSPVERASMFAAFEVVERLHELLWYLAEILERPETSPLRSELEGLRDSVDLAAAEPEGVDVVRFQARADVLLGEASALVRRPAGPDLRGHDLAGLDLRERDLVAANLRGTLLLGADLRDVDLGEADVLGTDLRGADVSGADLRTALFLTQFQVNAARGDAHTGIPNVLLRPAHW